MSKVFVNIVSFNSENSSFYMLGSWVPLTVIMAIFSPSSPLRHARTRSSFRRRPQHRWGVQLDLWLLERVLCCAGREPGDGRSAKTLAL